MPAERKPYQELQDAGIVALVDAVSAAARHAEIARKSHDARYHDGRLAIAQADGALLMDTVHLLDAIDRFRVNSSNQQKHG